MNRDEVLDVLEKLSPLRRKKLERADIPVQFMRDRIAVVLPADRYPADEQVRLEAKFQNRMTTQKGAHAFLDFVKDWRGLDSTLDGGFN